MSYVNVDGDRAVAGVQTDEDGRSAVRLAKIDGEWRIEEPPD